MKPEFELLAQKLSDSQGLEIRVARELAGSISSLDEDIVSAAIEWARTDIMPNQPEVEGLTPQSLSSALRPSQVFTGLAVLRLEGRSALNFVVHAGGSPSRSFSEALTLPHVYIQGDESTRS